MIRHALLSMLALSLLGGCFDATEPGPGRSPIKSYMASGPRAGDYYHVGDTVELTGYFRCGTGCILHFADSTLPLLHQDSVKLIFQVPAMSAPDSFWIELADTALPGRMLIIRYWNYSGDGTYYSAQGWPAGYELPRGCLVVKDTIFCLSCFNLCSGVYAASPGRSSQWELYPKTAAFKDHMRWYIDSAGGRLYIRTPEFWYERMDTGWAAMSSFTGGFGPTSTDLAQIYHQDGKLKMVSHEFWKGHHLWDYDPARTTWMFQDSIPFVTPNGEVYSRLYHCGSGTFLASSWVQGDTLVDSTGSHYQIRSMGQDVYRLTKPKRFVGRIVSHKTEIGPWDHATFCFENDLYVATGDRLLKESEDALVEQIDYSVLAGPYSQESLYGTIPITGLVRHGKSVIGLGKWMFYKHDGEPWKIVAISTQKFSFEVRTLGLGYEDLLGDRDPLWVDGLGNLWSKNLQDLPLHRLRF